MRDDDTGVIRIYDKLDEMRAMVSETHTSVEVMRATMVDVKGLKTAIGECRANPPRPKPSILPGSPGGPSIGTIMKVAAGVGVAIATALGAVWAM